LLVAAGSSPKKSSGSSVVPFLVLIALFALAYFVFIRPARTRQQAAAQARRQADVGDEIITTSGLIATVVAVSDDYLTLEVAPGVHARYVPAAILRVNTPDDEPDAAPDVSNHEVIETPTEPDQASEETERDPPSSGS
jgi:preprotein translocase subunit YajC